MLDLLTLIGFGLGTGALMMLPALGLSIQLSVDKFLNIAHGEFIAMGAYTFYVLHQITPLPQPLIFVLVVVAVAATGPVVERLVFAPIRSRSTLILLTTSLGLSLILQNSILAIFGVTSKRVEYDESWVTPIAATGPLRITPAIALILAVAGAAALSVTLFLRLTPYGKALRALAANPDLAAVSGVPVRRMRAMTWAGAAGLAGAGGALLPLVSSFTPDTGFLLLLTVVAGVLFGGLGSMGGVILGCLVIGIAMEVSTMWISPALRPGVALAILAAVLLIRPRGLFGTEVLK